MTAMTKLPDDHPLMIAWEKYRTTEEAQNSDKWAQTLYVSKPMQGQIIVEHPHLAGALWASFAAGFNAGKDALRNGEEIGWVIERGRSELSRPEYQIQHMVDRFLAWRLPENFNPDGGISFKRFGNEGTPHQYKNEPTGTNLLDAAQATEMVRYMVENAAGLADRPVRAGAP